MAGVGLGVLGARGDRRYRPRGSALKRVVIYRNGVGYFERAGHIKADRVKFKVKGNERSAISSRRWR